MSGPTMTTTLTLRALLLTVLCESIVMQTEWKSTENSPSDEGTPAVSCNISSGNLSARYWCEDGVANWQEALIACSMKGGTLAVIDSQPVYDALFEEGVFEQSNWWIGLTDQVSTGVFRWVNGKVIAWEKWHPRHPNHNFPDQHCVSMTADLWHTASCSTKLPFICQTLPTDFYCKASDPTCAPWINKDFDIIQPKTSCRMNVVYDTGEIQREKHSELCETLCRRAVHFICRSYMESGFCMGTSMNFSQLQEAGCVTQPRQSSRLVSRNYDPAYVDDRILFPLYAPDPHNATWHEARNACRALGKQLLTVKSAMKNTLLNSNRSWLGLTDEQSEGAYRWTDGTFTVYQNWQTGFPSGVKARNCAFRMYTSKWIDVQCSDKMPFLCENVSKCIPEPCRNGGTCMDTYDDYTCRCTLDFTGRNCTQRWYKTTYTLSSASLQLNFHHRLNMSQKTAASIIDSLEAQLVKHLNGSADGERYDVNIVMLRSSVLVDIEMASMVGLVGIDWPGIHTLVQQTVLDKTNQKADMLLTWVSVRVTLEKKNQSLRLTFDLARNVTNSIEKKVTADLEKHVKGFKLASVLVLRDTITIELHFSPAIVLISEWTKIQRSLQKAVGETWIEEILNHLHLTLGDVSDHNTSGEGLGNEISIIEYQSLPQAQVGLLGFFGVAVGILGTAMVAFKYKQFKEESKAESQPGYVSPRR